MALIHVESTVVPQAPPADGLDQWANQRDLGEQNSVSKRYVPEDMPGTQDLDNNGTWSEDGDNGPVWYPAEVAPGLGSLQQRLLELCRPLGLDLD